MVPTPVSRAQANAPSAASTHLSKTISLTHMDPLDSGLGRWMQAVYTEAFKRLGYTLTCRHVPAARASEMSENSISDGEFGRTKMYARIHPNLVRIQEPIAHVVMYAYMTRKLDTKLDLDKLKNTSWVLAFQSGLPELENLLKSFPRKQLYRVYDTPAGMRMLLAGRVDVLAGIQNRVEYHRRQKEFRNAPLYNVGELDSRWIYGYLAQKHAKLAKDVANVLRAMKAEGVLEAYARQLGVSVRY